MAAHPWLSVSVRRGAASRRLVGFALTVELKYVTDDQKEGTTLEIESAAHAFVSHGVSITIPLSYAHGP